MSVGNPKVACTTSRNHPLLLCKSTLCSVNEMVLSKKSSWIFIKFHEDIELFYTFKRHQQVHCMFSIGYLPITQISSQPCHQLEWLNLQIRSRHVKRRPSASSLYQQRRSTWKTFIFIRAQRHSTDDWSSFQHDVI